MDPFLKDQIPGVDGPMPIGIRELRLMEVRGIIARIMAMIRRGVQSVLERMRRISPGLIALLFVITTMIIGLYVYVTDIKGKSLKL